VTGYTGTVGAGTLALARAHNRSVSAAPGPAIYWSHLDETMTPREATAAHVSRGIAGFEECGMCKYHPEVST